MAERDAVIALLADYGWFLDERRFDDWLGLFSENCVYKVLPRENLSGGLNACLILCENKDMLRDRITALLKANKYNIHTARHVIGLPRISRASARTLTVEATYAVFQCNQEGEARLFSVGSYIDRVEVSDGRPRLTEKCVIVDSFSIPTLLATPL